jgi:hypothetical protein
MEDRTGFVHLFGAMLVVAILAASLAAFIVYRRRYLRKKARYRNYHREKRAYRRRMRERRHNETE